MGKENSSQPPASKHRRVGLACSQCRARKARCNGDQPACASCVAAGQQCSYKANSTKKRGLPTGHAHEMELRAAVFERVLGIAFSRDPTLEREILAILHSANGDSILDGIWPASVEFSDLSEFFADWRSSPVSHEFEQIIDLIKSKYGANAGRRRTQFIQQGHSSSADHPPAKRRMTSVSDLSPNSTHHLSLLAAAASTSLNSSPSMVTSPSIQSHAKPAVSITLDHVGKFLNPRDGSINYIGPSSGLSGASLSDLAFPTSEFPALFPFTRKSNDNALTTANAGETLADEMLGKPLPPDISHLLNMYFVTTHSWLPILDRFGIIRLAHQTSFRSAKETRMRDVADRGILWAVLALSTAHLDGSQKIYDQNSLSTLPRCELYASYALSSLNAAQALVTQSDDPFAFLSCAQLKTVLSLFYLAKGQWGDSWYFITSACRYAIDTGAFLDSPESASDTFVNSEIRNELCKRRLRAWAGCFVLDTIIASKVGMIPNLRAEDWQLPTVEETGADEWDVYQSPTMADAHTFANPARCLSVFNHYMALIRIWNIVLTSRLYLPARELSTSGDRSTVTLLSKQVDYLVSELRSWESELPSHCFFQEQLANLSTTEKLGTSNPTPYLINLNMTYLLVQSLVYSAVFNHPSLKVSTPESTTLTAATGRMYSRTLLGVSQLIRLILTTPTLYMHLLPPTFEYYVFRTTSLATFINLKDRNSIVNSAYGDYRTVLNKAMGFLKLVISIWPAAMLSYRVLSDQNDPKKALQHASTPDFASTIAQYSLNTPTAMGAPFADIAIKDNQESEKYHVRPDKLLSSTLAPASSRVNADFGDLSIFDMKASRQV